MISPTVVGALAIGVPSLFLAYLLFFWNRRPIFWFVVALTIVGLGYLASTGALREFGIAIVGEAETLSPVR